MSTKSNSKQELDKAIARVLASMEGSLPESPEYAEMVDQLVKLHGLKVNTAKKLPNSDTLATIAANLVGIILILHYERVDVIATKALSLLNKAR
jgi:hypothetical protein